MEQRQFEAHDHPDMAVTGNTGNNELTKTALPDSYAGLGICQAPGSWCVVVNVHHAAFSDKIGEIGVIQRVIGDIALVRPAKSFEPRLNRLGKEVPGPRYKIAWGLRQIGPAPSMSTKGCASRAHPGARAQ